MKDYACGIDIGSSELKVTFVARDGTILGPFKRELNTVYPEPLYAEQEPEQWLCALAEVLRDAFETGMVDKNHITAILPDAATHTTVLLDGRMKPVRRAIMWNDQRSAALAAECRHGDKVFELTNHMPGAMWSLFQNLWLKTYEPRVWENVRYMMFPKDYLRYRLTGVYCTDHIDAEGSELYDVHTRAWSQTLCDLLEFPAEQLPPIRRATDTAGSVTAEAAQKLGLREGTPIFTGTTDTALEIVAAGAIHKGQVTVKLATSGRICVISDRTYPHKQLVNYSHVIDGLFYPGTGTRSCASSLRWYKDVFAKQEAAEASRRQESVYSILDGKAAAIPAGCEGLFFHPYLLGEFTPYSNENLRASFTGASMKHNEAHFIRAIMEGTAYSMRDCMNMLESLGIKTDAGNLLLIGGGAKSRIWSGIVADMLDRKAEVPQCSDSSFGGAMLAGAAGGMFSSLEEAVERCCRTERVVTPNSCNANIYKKLFTIYTKTVTALTPIYEELSGILRSV